MDNLASTPHIIRQKVNEQLSNIDKSKTDWQSIQSKINDSISHLKREISTASKTSSSSHIPEQKAILKRIKQFSESQIGELHRYKRGEVNNSKISIPQQIRITSVFANKTNSKVTHKLQTKGIIFKKNPQEINRDTIKAEAKTANLTHEVTSLTNKIQGLEKGYASLITTITNVGKCLYEKQQLIEDCHQVYESGAKELKRFNKGQKGSSFNRELICKELNSQLKTLDGIKKGLAASAHLSDEDLLITFNDKSKNDGYINSYKNNYKEAKAKIDNLVKTMHEIEARDKQAETAKVKRNSRSFFAPRQKEAPPVLRMNATYIDVMSDLKSHNTILQNMIERLSKEPKKNSALIHVLNKKLGQFAALEKNILKNKVTPHTFEQETRHVAAANESITHLADYLEIATDIQLEKSNMSPALLDAAIENGIKAKQALHTAEDLLKKLTPKGETPLNTILIRDVRSRIEQMKLIGERFQNVGQLTSTRVTTDQKCIEECKQTCEEIQNLKPEKKLEGPTLHFATIISEWMKTEFEFSFALQGYLHQVDHDPEFFKHFSNEDQVLMKNFVNSARKVVETSLMVSQSMAAQTRSVLTEDQGNTVADLTAIFKHPDYEQNMQNHRIALREHSNYAAIIRDSPKNKKWTADLERSEYWLPDTLSKRMLEDKHVPPVNDALGDFAIRGPQILMRYISLSEQAINLGAKAASDTTTKEDLNKVFDKIKKQSEEESIALNKASAERLNSKLYPLMQKYETNIKRCKEATLVECESLLSDPKINRNSVGLTGLKTLREEFDRNGIKNVGELGLLRGRIEKEVLESITELIKKTVTD